MKMYLFFELVSTHLITVFHKLIFISKTYKNLEFIKKMLRMPTEYN